MSGRVSRFVGGLSVWIVMGTLTTGVLELFLGGPRLLPFIKGVVANAATAILVMSVGYLVYEVGFRRIWEILRKALCRDWLEIASFFIPKAIREPWLGDLREDRGRMRRAGCSRRFIFWATTVQLVLILILWLKDQIVSMFTGSPRNAG